MERSKDFKGYLELEGVSVDGVEQTTWKAKPSIKHLSKLMSAARNLDVTGRTNSDDVEQLLRSLCDMIETGEKVYLLAEGEEKKTQKDIIETLVCNNQDKIVDQIMIKSGLSSEEDLKKIEPKKSSVGQKDSPPSN